MELVKTLVDECYRSVVEDGATYKDIRQQARDAIAEGEAACRRARLVIAQSEKLRSQGEEIIALQTRVMESQRIFA